MIKKLLALLLSVTMITSLLPNNVRANEVVTGGEGVYHKEYDDYSVDFMISSDWGSGYSGEVTINNTGDEPIESWNLVFDFPNPIDSVWSANIAKQEDGYYQFKGLDHNSDIRVGESVTFGFSGTPGNISTYPSEFQLVTRQVQTNVENYKTEFEVTNDWGTGYNGRITITNNTNQTIEDWILEFDYEAQIDNFYTAEIVSHEDNHYIIKNAGYNANITSGQAITLDFGGMPGNVGAEPTNYNLYQMSENGEAQGPQIPEKPQDPQKPKFDLSDIEEIRNQEYDAIYFDELALNEYKEIINNTEVLQSQLISTYEQQIEEIYLIGIWNKNTDLFETRNYLVDEIEELIISGKVSEEQKESLNDIIVYLIVANDLLCNKTLKEVNAIIDNDNEEISNQTNEKYQIAIEKYNHAESNLDNSRVTEAMIKYKETYSVLLEGLYINEVEYSEDFIESIVDRDSDGLIDFHEIFYSTNIYKPDTDYDNLEDNVEVEILEYCSPTDADTDNDGVIDSEEDIDEDGLSNIEEVKLGTDLTLNDTDFDGLTDAFEVNEFGSNPLKFDTDEDGLSDNDEWVLGTDPNNSDSDGNGTLDSEEKFDQTVETIIKNEEKPEITKVEVNINTNGNLDSTTSIVETYGVNALSSKVVGLIGSPVDINTESKFEEATVTFTYDEALLGDTKEEDLGILWYNEEIGIFQVMTSEVDTLNKTVSFKTTHFSEYMVVDSKKWFEVWSKELDWTRKNTNIGSIKEMKYDIAIAIDSDEEYYNLLKPALTNLADNLFVSDKVGLVLGNKDLTFETSERNYDPILKGEDFAYVNECVGKNGTGFGDNVGNYGVSGGNETGGDDFNPEYGYFAKYRAIDFGKTITKEDIKSIKIHVHDFTISSSTNISVSKEGNVWYDIGIMKKSSRGHQNITREIDYFDFPIESFRYIKADYKGSYALDRLIVYLKEDLKEEGSYKLTSNFNEVKQKIENLESFNRTNMGEAVNNALNLLASGEASIGSRKMILLFSDGKSEYNKAVTERAKEKGIPIYTVGLGNVENQEVLNEIANETGGIYYTARTSEEVRNEIYKVYNEMEKKINDIDTDGDGIPDLKEIVGMNTQFGIIKTDPFKADTDGDGVPDGEEMGEIIKVSSLSNLTGLSYLNEKTIIYKIKSNPNKKDSDGDGFDDSIDAEPFSHYFKSITDEELDITYNFFRYLDNLIEDYQYATSLLGRFGGSKEYRKNLRKEILGVQSMLLYDKLVLRHKESINYLMKICEKEKIITKSQLINLEYKIIENNKQYKNYVNQKNWEAIGDLLTFSASVAVIAVVAYYAAPVIKGVSAATINYLSEIAANMGGPMVQFAGTGFTMGGVYQEAVVLQLESVGAVATELNNVIAMNQDNISYAVNKLSEGLNGATPSSPEFIKFANELRSLDNFKLGTKENAIRHIFQGEIRKGEAKGFHYEGAPGSKGKIVRIINKPNKYGVYEANVEVDGILKGGKSSFFPKNWTAQEVIDAVNEAFINKTHIVNQTYEGTISSGMKIQMLISNKGKIISAWPVY